ncbi:hypothetical protein PSEUBRA_002501 [Kalmanozyma brasiliensis GHG001]|uniref:Uncharacterized protein n=1 Tax=Kalmanozyma brasiliensis (strain GHG001) TaxID=1365824 RepID=V5EAK2_KALBG|nr:uncharacterized protein PSEUBRA_002501 [Kalmanozyma brasiliensis GHG001]EST07431.1 hypothetical protein PSEUBRA_002501 [Kalmanozyma brasiliensis GHG001]
MSNQGGTQSPPLQGRENDPMGQSAPGKSSKAVPDEEQRGGVFGSGENKGAESGEAGDSNNSGSGNLSEAVSNAKHADKSQPGK